MYPTIIFDPLIVLPGITIFFGLGIIIYLALSDCTEDDQLDDQNKEDYI